MFGNNNGYHGFGSLYRELREASDNGVITISPWWDYEPVVGADDSDGVEVEE
jgi:hypothetical protein